MPDTVIACINKLACNKSNNFIFTDRIGCTIGYAKTTGVDRDAADINKNQAPQYPPHKFQET